LVLSPKSTKICYYLYEPQKYCEVKKARHKKVIYIYIYIYIERDRERERERERERNEK
jgi:hypothetical protein